MAPFYVIHIWGCPKFGRIFAAGEMAKMVRRAGAALSAIIIRFRGASVGDWPHAAAGDSRGVAGGACVSGMLIFRELAECKFA